MVGAILWSRLAIRYVWHKIVRHRVIALCALQILVLAFVFRRVQLLSESDVATAVYYELSTIAQTTPALAGFLLAFVALRLPRIEEETESLIRYRVPSVSAALARFVRAIQKGYIETYQSERKSIIRRTGIAMAVSALTILASLLGLAIVPWLSSSWQGIVLVTNLSLALPRLTLWHSRSRAPCG